MKGPEAEGLEAIVMGFAGAMEAAHNWGANRMVEGQLKELEPKILNDLKYAGPGGVLIVAKFKTDRTDAGSFHSLIGDRISYVGIGETPADAALSNFGAWTKQELGDQSPVDPEASVAYWFKNAKDGELSFGQMPLSWLQREVAQEFSKREMAKYDWRLKREQAFSRLIRLYKDSIVAADARTQIEALESSRDGAIRSLRELNDRLNQSLEDAGKAEENARILEGIGNALTVANFIYQASNGLSQSNAATVQAAKTKEEAGAELGAIIERETKEIAALKAQIEQMSQRLKEIEGQLQTDMGRNNVPINNLPPDYAPPVIIRPMR
jgi:chaperonin cofactor prefoldin